MVLQVEESLEFEKNGGKKNSVEAFGPEIPK